MMMKTIAAAAVLSVAAAMPASNDFGAWKMMVGKTYESKDEEVKRLQIFNANVAMINQHNAEAERGEHSFTMGLGPFTDLSNEEFVASYISTTFEQYANYTKNIVRLPEVRKLHGHVAADSKDWRTEGAVTKVKNQGQCGGCWAFSTTGSTEGANKIAGNELISLSEQQLIDCSTKEGNKGCHGGIMDAGFKYIISNGGLDTEADYEYEAKNGQCDTEKESRHAATISGSKDVPPNEEAQLLAAVTQQPVSIAIEADKPAFQHYKTGVFTSESCGTKLDHGVLVVGYGTDSGKDYWIVKNSWGAVWGDEGFIKIERDGSSKGVCGINMQPSYPKATKGPPPSPGPSPPPAPGGECSVPTAERHRCGFLLGKSGCEAKGCCYDNTHPFADHCFHPASGPGPSPPGPPPPPPAPPTPGAGHYGDPNSGPCKADEKDVSITGVAGKFCSPTCSTSQPCPTDVPTGTTASPECVLEASGSSSPSNCALICRMEDVGLVGKAGGCPDKATCKQIQTSALCTYDN